MSSRDWTSEPVKAIPVDADQLLILDSADTDNNKLIDIGTLPFSKVGVLATEVFSTSDLPAPSAGVITLTSGVYIFKNSITFSDRIDIPSSQDVTLISEDEFNTILTYSGTDTFITGTNSSNVAIRNVGIVISGSNATFLDVTDGDVNISALSLTFTGTGTQTLGTMININTFILSNSGLREYNVGFILNASIVAITESSFVSDLTGTSPTFDINAVGSDGVFNTMAIVIGASESIFDIDSGITGPIGISAIIDVNGLGDFYEATGLDQTAINVTATNNTDSPDSTVSGVTSIVDIASPEVVTITTQDVPVAINGTTWTSASLERFTIDGGGNGILTYIALETQQITINYFALLEKSGGGATDIEITLLLNGSEAGSNPPRSVNAGIIQISGTDILTLTTGDTLQLAVTNRDGTSNIEVSQANMVTFRS